MRWHHLRRTRAGMAASVLVVVPALAALRGEELAGPVPGPGAETETVPVLHAVQSGTLKVSARGDGETRVHLTLRNTSPHRLNVVLPPGLVAAATAGQFGFQSMGLGPPTDRPGAFGEFRSYRGGFRSVGVEGPATPSGRAIAVPAGQAVDLALPAVCLNFGLPTPTPRDRFRLMDVEDYTPDVRARKALRSLATLGTSQKVAQAVAWNVFNGMNFPRELRRVARYLNVYEVALAARFVEALDASGDSGLVDPAYLRQGRLFVRVKGNDATAKDAARLAAGLADREVLGLPIRAVDGPPAAGSVRSALFLDVDLATVTPSLIRGRVAARSRAPGGGWQPLGAAEFETARDGAGAAALADGLDRAIAAHFVRVKPGRRSPGLTTLTLENRLPMTIANATLLAGPAGDAGAVSVGGVGIGPARVAPVTIPAAGAQVERIELNGL